VSAVSAQQRNRALLDTISWAEGTWDSKAGRPRYDITFGYQSVDPSKPHPGRVVRSGGYASDASGAYQFLSTTWKGVHGGSNKPLTPENQDAAALELVRRRGVDPSQPLDAKALGRLAPEWASLPTVNGRSYYGQPVKDRQALLNFYNQRLATAPNPGNGTITVAAAGGGPPTAAAEDPALAGGADGGLLQLLAAQAGGGGVDLTPLLAGDGGGRLSPLAVMAANQQQQLSEQMENLGASLQPTTLPRLPSALQGGSRRFAGSPFFAHALSLLG
jgi:muramidase (phage lysozyme)